MRPPLWEWTAVGWPFPQVDTLFQHRSVWIHLKLSSHCLDVIQGQDLRVGNLDAEAHLPASIRRGRWFRKKNEKMTSNESCAVGLVGEIPWISSNITRGILSNLPSPGIWIHGYSWIRRFQILPMFKGVKVTRQTFDLPGSIWRVVSPALHPQVFKISLKSHWKAICARVVSPSVPGIFPSSSMLKPKVTVSQCLATPPTDSTVCPDAPWWSGEAVLGYVGTIWSISINSEIVMLCILVLAVLYI